MRATNRGPLRLALAGVLGLSMAPGALALDNDPAIAAPTFEYCARVVSAGAEAIESEAERLGLVLGPLRSVDDAPAFANAVRQLFPSEVRIRVAAPAAGGEYVLAIVDELGEGCLAGVGADDASLLQHLRGPASEWQFAFTDAFTGASVFDWPGVEGGESVRTLRFRPIRSDPIPSTFHERAPFAVSPPLSEEVRDAWVIRVLEMCLASAHEGALPEPETFAPYLTAAEDEGNPDALRSPRGQPPAQFWIGANNSTCSLISHGENGRLLLAAFERELRRRGGIAARNSALAFSFPRPDGAGHGASVQLMSLTGGVHAVIIVPALGEGGGQR